MSLDSVHIEGLRTRAVIGCYGWERLVKQPLVFDIELSGDFSRAASSDDVTHALDYAAISSSVKTFVEASSFQLLEALIEAVAEQLLNIAAVEKVKLRVRKPYAVADASVGISIERTRS
jgi:dihydroneopterin aldolase